MILNAPAIIPSVDESGVSNLIYTLSKSKGWEGAIVQEMKLIYFPFWVFNYHTYTGESGKGAIDALDGALAQDIAALARFPRRTREVEAQVFSPAISEDEAKEVAKAKIVHKLGVGKEDVVISGLQLIYVPFWHVTVLLGKKTHVLIINAVSGQIVQGDIPERPRGWEDAFSDALAMMLSPEGWKEFLKETGLMLREGAKKIGEKAKIKKVEKEIERKGLFHFLFHTKTGLTILFLSLLVIYLYLANKGLVPRLIP